MYHRGTNVEQIRAPATSRPTLIARQRLKQSLQHLEGWEAKHGRVGTAVIEHEFDHHKRLVQFGKKRNIDRVKRMTDGAFYGRVYRYDELANEDIRRDCIGIPPLGPHLLNAQANVCS